MPGGGGRFLLKIPGGGSPGGRGAEGPGGCLRRIGELGGGGLNIFFSGPECPPRTSPFPRIIKVWLAKSLQNSENNHAQNKIRMFFCPGYSSTCRNREAEGVGNSHCPPCLPFRFGNVF